MRTIWLKTRMGLCIIALFAILYALITVLAYMVGVDTPLTFAVLALVIVAVQYMLGPKIVERSMKVRYVESNDAPELYRVVEDLAMRAGIPMPRVGIAEVGIPNAFAFGRSKRDGRVCVTRAILNLLNEDELRAVLAHEISHIKHRDMVVITALSVVPMICYWIYFSFFWSGVFGRRRDGGGTLAIAAIAFVVYFISNLLVLYASRIREYYADMGGAELTGQPHQLASALYKLTYGSARISKDDLRSLNNMRAFFATDPASAVKDTNDLMEADLNRDGKLDAYEVQEFARNAHVGRFDRIMETFSTHPNMVNRIKRLAEYQYV